MAETSAWVGQEHSSEVFPSVTYITEDLRDISEPVAQVGALW